MGKRLDDWVERAVPKRRWWAITCGVVAIAGLAFQVYVLPTKVETWGVGLGVASFVIYCVPFVVIGLAAVLAVRRARRRGWGPTEPEG